MNRFSPLPRRFFLPSAQEVAPELLGHFLLRQTSAGLCGGPIVEVEAYLVGDEACHASVGLTARNRVMFGEPGYAYVYFIYGCHYCVNAVCQPPGVAEAVLIRAIEPEFGVMAMFQARPVKSRQELTNGPAKLCEAMGIDRKLDGVDLCGSASPLFVAQNPSRLGFVEAHGGIRVTPRIGITKAAMLPLRFYLQANTHVSRRAFSDNLHTR